MTLVRARIAVTLLIAFLLFACSPAAVPPSSQPGSAGSSGSSNLASDGKPIPFQGPLSVVVTSPADDGTVASSPVEITGQANPGTVISFNDTVVLVDSTRVFHARVDLKTGENLVEITASDPQGSQATAYMSILYQP